MALEGNPGQDPVGADAEARESLGDVSGLAAGGESGQLGDEAIGDLELEEQPRRWPIALVALLAIAGIGWFGVEAFESSTSPHVTPSEALAESPEGTFRLAGQLVEGSLHRDAGLTHFEVEDGSATVAVRFEGRPPESLAAGTETVANGRLTAEGVFEADDVLAECASRFEAELEP